MTSTAEITVRPAGMVRQEFDAIETTHHSETAAAAVAAREQALVQAKFLVALKRPRDIEQFRVRLESECKRPSFAKLVKYSRPAGKKLVDGKWVEEKAEGPTIRFVETALQCFTNVDTSTTVVFEHPQFRMVRAAVLDLERNICYTSDIVISKQVERKGFENRKTGVLEPPKGREVISKRTNSVGEEVYTVLATDDETTTKQNALQSKNIRTNGLRLLPRDIVDHCMAIAAETVAKKDAQDPDAAKREIIDHFVNDIGVQPVDLAAFLGHSLDRPFLPAEIATLRGVYAAIKDGATWQEILESKEDTGSEELQKEVRDRKVAEAQAAITKQQQAPTTADTAQKGEGSQQGGVGTPAVAEGAAQESTGGESKPAGPKLQFGKKQQQ